MYGTSLCLWGCLMFMSGVCIDVSIHPCACMYAARFLNTIDCVTYSTNYQQRLTLESWYTNSEQEPLNRCQQLPAPYKRLIHDLKRNQHTSTNNRRIKDNSKTKTDESLQLSRFDQSHHNKIDQSKPQAAEA